MKIVSLSVGEYLSEGQFIIPVYQRPYQWGDDLLEGLWSDLGEMYEGVNTKSHYLGVLLTSPDAAPESLLRGEGPAQLWKAAWPLVDGQQRLVTVLLLLAALRDRSSLAAKKRLKRILTTPAGPRLVGQEEDRDLLTRILATEQLELSKSETKTRVGNAYYFFRRQLTSGRPSFWRPAKPNTEIKTAKGLQKFHLPALVDIVLDRLDVTDMLLEPAQDQSAPAVFDAINGKRRELDPVDLLRNTVFAELDDIPLFTSTWATIETESRNVKLASARLGTLPLFIDSYLHSLGESASQHRIARRLNELILKHAPLSLGAATRRKRMRDVVQEIVDSFDDFKVCQSTSFRGYSGTYGAEVVRAVDNINMLSSGPPLPLCLLFIRHNRLGKLRDHHLLGACRHLESYLGRRVVVGAKQQLLRSHLTSVTKQLIKEFGNASDIGPRKGKAAIGQLPDRLAQLLATQGMPMPTNSEVVAAVTGRCDMNKLSARQKFAILRRLNDQMAGRHVPNIDIQARDGKSGGHSIEHVFPDSFRTPADITPGWQAQLRQWGAKRATVRATIRLRNNLGNYTLVHHNSALGRRPFLDAGRMKGKRHYLGDRAPDLSVMVLNVPSRGGRVQRTQWMADDINARAVQMAADLRKAYPGS